MGWSLFLVLLVLNLEETYGNPCKFNAACDCQNSIVLTTTVHCYNFTTFPVFTVYNDTLVEAISITGTFTDIPPYAFIALKFVPLGISMAIGRNEQTLVPLFIDEYAFYNVPIENLSFSHISFSTMPTPALANRTIKNLNFAYGKLEYIDDYAFYGLTVTDSLRFAYNGIRLISQLAFKGMNNNGSVVLKSFYSDENFLNEVPSALKTIKIEELSLLRCNISKLVDYSFCTSGSSCAIVQLDLTGNPISAISSNAFGYMPLQQLSLYSLNLTSLPLALNVVASTLQTLDIRSNKITDVSSTNTFSILTSLASVKIDYNPISEIYYSYSLTWGSRIMTKLFLSNLNSLTMVDFGFISSMSALQEITITSCPFFTTVYLSNGNLPSAVNLVNLTGNDIQSLASFNNWFQQKQNAIIDISYNYNFNCESTSNVWMAKYIVCKPAKILTTESTCMNTKLPLEIYFRTTHENSTLCK